MEIVLTLWHPWKGLKDPPVSSDHTLRNSGRCFETPLKASISSTDFSLKCSLENDEPAVWHWSYRTYWQVVKLCKGLYLTLLLIPSISVNSKHKNDVATKPHCRKTIPSHPQPPYPMTSLSIPLSTHGIALTCLSNRSWADPEISEKWKVVPFLKRVGEYIKYTLLILTTKYKQGLKKNLPGSLQIAAVNPGSLTLSKSSSN